MGEIKIIDHPSLKSLFRKSTEWTVTTILWSLWVYLILPLGNLIIWILSGRYFYREFIEQLGYLNLMAFLSKSLWLILIIFLIICGWSTYNYFVFGRKNRRTKIRPATPEALAAFFGLPIRQIMAMQSRQETSWTRSSQLKRNTENPP